MMVDIDPKEWESVKAQVSSVYNVITGNDPINKQVPLLERVAKLEKSQNFVKIILIAFALGLLAGALFFGLITMKQFSEAIKVIK